MAYTIIQIIIQTIIIIISIVGILIGDDEKIVRGIVLVQTFHILMLIFII